MNTGGPISFGMSNQREQILLPFSCERCQVTGGICFEDLKDDLTLSAGIARGELGFKGA